MDTLFNKLNKTFSFSKEKKESLKNFFSKKGDSYSLKDDGILKLLLVFVGPAVLGLLINVLYNVVDRIFVGQFVGAEGLSAVTMVFPITLLQFSFVLLFGSGSGVLIAKSLGENRLDKAEQDNKIVILTGEGGIFSGGFDLKVMTKSADSAKELVTKGSKLSLRMLSFPKPIIIACNGHAIAKGAFLLLSADYRIGLEDDFKIGLNEVMIGMTMHNAGIAIAKARLSEVYLNRSVNNAEIFSSKDAVKAGFLDTIVPKNHLLPTAIKVAGMFSKLHPKAHAETKLKVRKMHLQDLENSIALDLASEIAINS